MPFLLIAFFICLVWLVSLSVLYLKLYRHFPKTLTQSTGQNFKINVLKFNPFSDTGGDQSFVLSLLDRGGSGILLTSLHGRGATRIYVKKIINGKSEQELSTEEKQVLLQSQHE